MHPEYRRSDMCCYFVVLLALCVKGVCCLRMVSLQVPTKVVVGDAIKLSCGYDLEGDPLYSIKWYRDDVEFFRFVPRDRPPGQFFPLKGVTVDMVRSANGTVIMEDTDESTTGTYKCEVSADAPSFQTVSAQKRLIVKEFPSLATSLHVTTVLLPTAILCLLRFLW